MTDLKCSANTCTSYKDGFCCRPSIKVQGSGAVSAAETCCMMYTGPGSGVVTNLNDCTPANPSLEILCSADECTFNSNMYCSAQSVSIKGCGSQMSGTECETFSKK